MQNGGESGNEVAVKRRGKKGGGLPCFGVCEKRGGKNCCRRRGGRVDGGDGKRRQQRKQRRWRLRMLSWQGRCACPASWRSPPVASIVCIRVGMCACICVCICVGVLCM